MTREDLLQAARAVIKAALELTDDQVRVGHEAGPMGSDPYLTVDLLAYDIRDTITDDVDARLGEVDEGGPEPAVRLLEQVTGHRRATAQVTAIGDEAAQWLSLLSVELASSVVAEVEAERGVGVQSLGSPRSAQVFRDTAYALQPSCDLELTYQVQSKARVIGEVTAVSLGFEASPQG